MMNLIATMFGFKAVMQKIDPPWMPPPSALGQILDGMSLTEAMSNTQASTFYASENDPA